MLKNAKNYEEEIKRSLRETWYDPEYQYYHSDSYHSDIDLSDDRLYAFVSCIHDKIIGFISYRIDRSVNGVRQFGAISFDKGNPVFARDTAQAIDDIFLKYHFNRLEWYCIVGNPVGDFYLKFIKEHGGRVMANEHECVRTLDGCIRDSIGFEILSRDYIPVTQKESIGHKLSGTKNTRNSLKHSLIDVLANRITGRQYGSELEKDEEEWAKKNGLVVVFGASDDLAELRGAIDDEFDCFGGGEIVLDTNGVNIDGKTGEYFGRNIIKVLWSDDEDTYYWQYKTDIPHRTFEIFEGDIPYCLGIIFAMKDLE